MQQNRPNSDRFFNWLGNRLARKLRSPSPGFKPYTPSDYETLCSVLMPGDVLLVEGNERVSSAIKYVTQSTWSHAAMFVGNALSSSDDGRDRPRLIEVVLGEGCVAAPLTKYERFYTRICRAQALTDEDRDKVVRFMVSNLGLEYDVRNVFDLLRYFLELWSKLVFG